MNHEVLIQQCRKELEKEIAKLFCADNSETNDDDGDELIFGKKDEKRIHQIKEREVSLAIQLVTSETFSNIPLQRVIDNYFLEFEKQVIKPLEMMEQAFEKCFLLFYETLWKQEVELNNDDNNSVMDEYANDGATVKEEYFDIGMKISERGNYVEINYWSLVDHSENKLVIPYDLRNVVSVFKELLINENVKPIVEPISVFKFLFKLSLHIEKIKFLTLVDQCKSKDSILLKSICINRCFLDKDTILNIDEERNITDEDNDMIFHNSTKNFESQREKIIDKIVSEHLTKNKVKDEGLNLVCKNGIMEKRREEVTDFLLEKERLFLNHKLNLRSQIVKDKSSGKTSKYVFDPIEIPKEKKQEKFIDFVYKTRGFNIHSTDHLSNMKFAEIIDKNTSKREKKPVPQFDLPSTPKNNALSDGALTRTASTLIGEYLRNVSLKNNAFEQYNRDRMNLMQNRLENVSRDHFTTLIIRRMRNRLKYLLSQPNHKVSVERKEEAIIGFLRMLSQ